MTMSVCAQSAQTDIVIYGATSAGISAAVQSARMGKSVVIVEPGNRIGGLTTGGLGRTDIGNRQAIGGISLEFYKAVHKYYNDDGAQKPQPQVPSTSRKQPKASVSAQKSQAKTPSKSRAQTKTGDGETAMWIFEPSVALAILEKWARDYNIKIIKNERLDRNNGAIWDKVRGASISRPREQDAPATLKADFSKCPLVDYGRFNRLKS
jgi:monoamine oxidase